MIHFKLQIPSGYFKGWARSDFHPLLVDVPYPRPPEYNFHACQDEELLTIPVCLLPSNWHVLSVILCWVHPAPVLGQAPHHPECPLTLGTGGKRSCFCCRAFPLLVICGGSGGRPLVLLLVVR